MEMKDRVLIRDKVSGFLLEAALLGYSWDDAWSLLLNSKQGRGILNNDYTYSVHFQGMASAMKADADIGHLYKKNSHVEVTSRLTDLIADFIDTARYVFNIDYDHMFSRMSFGEFMATCGNALGNYDDKLIKAYLLKQT